MFKYGSEGTAVNLCALPKAEAAGGFNFITGTTSGSLYEQRHTESTSVLHGFGPSDRMRK